MNDAFTTGIDTSGADDYITPTRSWFMQYAAMLVDANRGRVGNLSLDFRFLRDVISYGDHYNLPPEAIIYAERKLSEYADAGRGDSAAFLVDAYAIRGELRARRAREVG